MINTLTERAECFILSKTKAQIPAMDKTDNAIKMNINNIV
jgi:hypothetical protein